MTDRATPHTTRRALGCALAILLGIPLSWIGAHRVSSGFAPEPLGSAESVLQSPGGPNGWGEIVGRRVHVDPPQSLTVLASAATDARPVGEAALVVDAESEALSRFVAEPDTREANERMLRAILAPRFVDECPLELTGACNVLDVLWGHRAVALTALDGSREAPGAALATATQLLRADLDHLGTARSLISHVVAIEDANAAVWLLRILVARGALSEVAPAEREAIRDLLDGLDPDAIHLERGVIAENLMMHEALRGDLATEGDALGVLALDLRQTLTLLNREHEAWLAAARARAGQPPPYASRREGLFWWAYNPVGKTVLDVVLPTPEVVGSFHDERALLLAQLGSLRAALDAPPPSRPAPAEPATDGAAAQDP